MVCWRVQVAWIFLFAGLGVTTQAIAEDDVGPILKPGWNLIGIPVSPADPKVASVFATVIKLEKLLSVWAYDSNEGWSKIELAGRNEAAGPPHEWTKPVALPKVPADVKSLTIIEAGKAYWVEVKADAPGDGIPLRYQTRIVASKSVGYGKGWNLVAFDADTKQKFQRAGTQEQSKTPQPVARSSMTAAFGLVGSEIVRPSNVVRYDQTRKKLVSTKPESNGNTDDKDSDAGEWLQRGTGYWCYFPQACSLAPTLVTILAGDIDFEPKRPAPFPGAEDFDANRDGELDGPKDQNTMSVGYGANSVAFLVRNEGSGLLSFQIQPAGYWKANTSVFEPYPKVDSEHSELVPKHWTLLGDGAPPWLVEISGEHGVTPRSLDDGILADVKDTAVRLTIDRTKLEPGHYLLRIQLLTTAGNKTLYLHVTVPPLVGDFEGRAFLSHVNGRRNDVGSIDFRLCITRDPNGTIMGVIDSNGTGIVPMDVPIVGHQIGSRIFLYGAYSLPGRRPIFTPVEGGSAIPVNVDDSRPQLNPFQKRLTRFITIEGIETTPGKFCGDIHDIFYGDLPFPVHASGLASDSAGIELERSAIAQNANTWFPIPKKSPRGAYPLKGAISNLGNGANSDHPRLHVTLTGMGRTGVAAVAHDGTWILPSVFPGIYRISVSGGSSRVFELTEIAKGDSVTAAITPIDDIQGDPCQLSYFDTANDASIKSSLASFTAFAAEVPADLGKGKTRLKCDGYISQGTSFRRTIQPGVTLSVSTTRTLTIKGTP